MDVREALYTTRAMRRMAPDPIPDDVIARIVDAGVRAPSPGATQAWRFVVVTDRGRWRVSVTCGGRRATRSSSACRTSTPARSRRRRRSICTTTSTPYRVVIFGYGPEGLGNLTVVPALWSMCLAARGEGIGSVFTSLLAGVADQVDEILGVPNDSGLRLIGSVPMGIPLGRWGVAPRAPAQEVTFVDDWGTAPRWSAEPPDFA